MTARLRAALQALAGQVGPAPMEARLEASIDKKTNDVLLALALEMSRGNAQKARTKRSAAARELMRRGAMQMLADGQQAA